MDNKTTIELVDFFRKIQISTEDVTTEEERANGQLALIVTYSYNGQKYTTKKLYYKNVNEADYIKDPEGLTNYFGEPVYWLDLDIHDWPKPSGESDLDDIVIKDIYEGDQPEFNKFLMNLANNAKTGKIQLMTTDGRSEHYHHNLENNNHWHDIVLLIQAIINSKGELPDKKYFCRLVFRWQDSERVSLSPHFGNRKIINDLLKNIKSIQNSLNTMDTINILKYKNQIILQGPPGTGKTMKAKLIAREMCLPSVITEEDITRVITKGVITKTPKGGAEFEVIDISNGRIIIKPKGSRTGDTREIPIKGIIESYSIKHWDVEDDSSGSNIMPYRIGLAKYIYENVDKNYWELVQFHPSYTYEDFVRGISAQSNGNNIEYITENKILVDFASRALRNHLDSRNNVNSVSKEKWIEDKFEDFIETIQSEIDKPDGKYYLTDSVYVTELKEGALRYQGDNWKAAFTLRYTDLIKLYSKNIQKRAEIKEYLELVPHVKWQLTYTYKFLEKFSEFIGDKKYVEENHEKPELKNYVLIIDEINRANLPSVLGELIYALEYRDEEVESIYDLEGDGRKIVLPPNLYIIGTMNIADRSVGHIDYAIRRRFAFIDVLPDREAVHDLAKSLFKTVSELFIKNYETYSLDTAILETSGYLSPDFRAEDVWIGHSYFLIKEDERNRLSPMSDEEILNMKLNSEIKPILKEYLKDGVLKQNAKVIIDSLSLKQ